MTIGKKLLLSLTCVLAMMWALGAFALFLAFGFEVVDEGVEPHLGTLYLGRFVMFVFATFAFVFAARFVRGVVRRDLYFVHGNVLTAVLRSLAGVFWMLLTCAIWYFVLNDPYSQKPLNDFSFRNDGWVLWLTLVFPLLNAVWYSVVAVLTFCCRKGGVR